jgi:outer membrane protein, heavy metal efflux system
MMARVLTPLFCLFSILNLTVEGRDTLRISIPQADSMFLRNNFRLLASMLDIDAQKARILQARLYPNPILTADFNAYDPENEKLFHVNRTGQKIIQLEQLIILGGKRRAEIDLAKTNAAIAELAFQEMIRQLRFELHASLHSLNQQLFLIRKFNTQLSLLDTILTAYETQAKRGNIPLRDVVRLKGIYLHINNDRAESLKLFFEEMNDVQTILQTDAVIVPVIGDTELDEVIRDAVYQELEDLAFLHRPDYLLSVQNTTASQQYLNVQKRLATPDVNLIGSYDQRGGAFVNQINIGVAMPLPVWNRNQGNIRASRYYHQQAEFFEQDIRQQIRIQLQNNLAMYHQAVQEYRRAVALYDEDFEITLKGVSDNFQKRNVSLLEFVDFFESYNNALEEIVRIKIQLAVSAELLNFTIGRQIF